MAKEHARKEDLVLRIKKKIADAIDSMNSPDEVKQLLELLEADLKARLANHEKD